MAVFAIDAVQRRRHGVFEYSRDPKCILRASRTENRERIELSDGTTVEAGDPILEIHFWNERVPSMPATGPDLGWGLRFTNRWFRSLRLLARYVDAHREYDDIVAIRGESSFAVGALRKYGQVTGRMGFDFQPLGVRGSASRLAEFFTNLYVWAIVWVVHPTSLQGRSVRSAERGELWMSRHRLMSRYSSRSELPIPERRLSARKPMQTAPRKPPQGRSPAPQTADSQQ